MRVDVVLSPAEIALLPSCDLGGTTCVVFDVLRATSSIVTAFAHGVGRVIPVATVEEALEWKGRVPEVLLGGERHGERIEGFDLGNSPFEYREGVKGKELVTTTTNGTVALRACAGAEHVLVGALLNLKAVAEVLRQISPERVLIVCAGTFSEFALEDAMAAGALVGQLEENFGSGVEWGDAARAVSALPLLYRRPEDALRASKNGRVLEKKGRGREVEWCALCSEYRVVPVLEGESLRLWEA
jgi:2-phosphosulfolactate phosphatase